MNNEQVMKLMADNGMHEGGMDNWVPDNAWVKFANLVAAQEREECAKECDAVRQKNEDNGAWMWEAKNCAASIRARGTT